MFAKRYEGGLRERERGSRGTLELLQIVYLIVEQCDILATARSKQPPLAHVCQPTNQVKAPFFRNQQS